MNQAPCLCRRGAAVVRSGDLCVHSFRVVLELCVMDEEGVFVGLCAFLLAVFAFDFHWNFALWLKGLPRLQPFVYLTHDMYMRSNTHILYLPSYLRSVWISHKAVVKQVESLTHPTDEPFTPVRCVSKGRHTSQKDLLSSVGVLRLWLKCMLVWWRLESFSLQGLQLPYKLEGANLVPVHFRVSLLSCA